MAVALTLPFEKGVNGDTGVLT